MSWKKPFPGRVLHLRTIQPGPCFANLAHFHKASVFSNIHGFDKMPPVRRRQGLLNSVAEKSRSDAVPRNSCASGIVLSFLTFAAVFTAKPAVAAEDNKPAITVVLPTTDEFFNDLKL